jgi:hypothetical protein
MDTVPNANIAFQRTCEALLSVKIEEAIAAGRFETSVEYCFAQDPGVQDLLQAKGYTVTLAVTPAPSNDEPMGYVYRISWLPADLPKKPKLLKKLVYE